MGVPNQPLLAFHCPPHPMVWPLLPSENKEFGAIRSPLWEEFGVPPLRNFCGPGS